MFGKQRKFRGVERDGLIRCSHCEEWLAVDMFGIAKGRGGTGRQSYCKPCVSTQKALNRGPEVVERNLHRQREAYRLNPEKAFQKKAVRRARAAKVPSEWIYRDRVYFAWNGLCGICWYMVDPTNWHLDHIIPIAKGGAHLYDNVQPTHPFCNISKGAKVYVG